MGDAQITWMEPARKRGHARPRTTTSRFLNTFEPSTITVAGVRFVGATGEWMIDGTDHGISYDEEACAWWVGNTNGAFETFLVNDPTDAVTALRRRNLLDDGGTVA